MDLLLSLVPLAAGIIVSPLAIMALVAVLLSRDARTNGIAFLAGWTLAVSVALTGSFVVLGLVGVHQRDVQPAWAPVLRLFVGLALSVWALSIYRKGKVRNQAMAAVSTPSGIAAATPQLPNWLRIVESFTPLRSFLLGFGIFLLNPVDLSCAVIAALDLRLENLGGVANTAILVCFGIIAILPIGTPVILVLARGASAIPLLNMVRDWIALNTHVLNAALVLVIALLQVQKAVTTLLAS